MRRNALLGTPVLSIDGRGRRMAQMEIGSGAENCFDLSGKCDCHGWHSDVMRKRQEAFCDANVLVLKEDWMSCWRAEDGELYFTVADL